MESHILFEISANIRVPMCSNIKRKKWLEKSVEKIEKEIERHL